MYEFQENKTQTLDRLGVNPETGLSPAQVEQSLQTYGRNEFTREKPKSFLKRMLEAAKEPMIILLIVAGIITLSVNIIASATGGHADYIECIGIFVAIALSIAITVIMEGRSAKAFETLNSMKDDINARVIRDGRVSLISQKDLAVGDIVLVETGDKLPADGRLLSSVDLSIDESSLTGESLAVKKDSDAVLDDEKTPVAERINMLYSGCFVTGGSGKMVITGVGDATEFGKIARELSKSESSSTPIQEKLAKLGKIIAIIGVSIATIIFIIECFRLGASGGFDFKGVSDAFITSIVLIVATVPEGLPTIVAISLALNIIKMSKQNALVKKLVACETIGSINVICSDKTGTLTQNRMTVIHAYTNGELLTPEQLTDDLFFRNCCINSTANVEFDKASPEFIGNPTECALLVACHKAGQDYTALREQADVAVAYPFSSETKCMTTVVQEQGKFIAYTKGSPEKVMAFCSTDPSVQAEIERQITHFQSKACRVLGFAHKEVIGWDETVSRETIEQGMIYDGFVVISDPLRDDVYDAVANCRSAGIDIKMLTGDNIITAKAIASDLGILDDSHIAVEARELEDLSEDQFYEIIPKVRVIARSTPVIKMRVVNTLKAQGNVVAVTGDGINDAPAIKNADVGIAMGISGTEVSKDASDIVLLDDSFSTIATAVKWGRGIYENFQRFIQFQLTVNLSSVIVVLASILAGLAAPFTALQLLWINIVMDGPPALTLGLEPIREDLMKNAPTGRNDSVVTKKMMERILINGLFIAFVFLTQSFGNILGGTPEQASTILFTLFVIFQLFNAFNSRELGNKSILKSISSNNMMLGVFAITFLLQVVITQFGGVVFSTVPLPLMMWVKITLLAFSVIVFSEIIKLIVRLVKKEKI